MAEYRDENDHPGGVTLIGRREAIRRVALFLGGTTLVGGSALLTACERERPPAPATGPVGEFTSADIAYLDEIAETILPETKTPGAKAAKTGAFMALMVTDSYDPRDQSIFRDGMRAVEERCRAMHGVGFMSASPEQRLALLKEIDREQKVYMDARAARLFARDLEPLGDAKILHADAVAGVQALGPDAIVQVTADSRAHYFRMMKELALLGYFTSEIGCTQAQRYAETPGRFVPCVPYRPGEKTWAPHA